MYRKLTDAVNKKLKRDWDKVEAEPERAEPICIPSQCRSSERPSLHLTKPSGLLSNHVMRKCFDMVENITSRCWKGAGQRPSSGVLAPGILPADSRFILPAAAVYRPGRGDAAAAPYSRSAGTRRRGANRRGDIAPAEVNTVFTEQSWGADADGTPSVLIWPHPFHGHRSSLG